MNTLSTIEIEMQQHLSTARIYLFNFCQCVAQIAEERIWKQENYPSFRAYMLKRWSIGKTQAYEMWKIGRYVDNSETAENLTITQLSALANVKPEYRTATLEALERLPTDKITASAINRLSDVIEVAITTGAVEVSEGNQIQLDHLDAIEAGVLLELVESRKRQLDHVNGKNPPIFSQNGINLSEALQTASARNIPLHAPSTIEIFETDNLTRIVIRVSKEKVGVG